MHETCKNKLITQFYNLPTPLCGQSPKTVIDKGSMQEWKAMLKVQNLISSFMWKNWEDEGKGKEMW